MKIDFKKPKYILPLIILPFLFIFYYVFASWSGDKQPSKKELIAQREAQKGEKGLNPSLPGVSQHIAKENLKNKFKSLKNNFKNMELNKDEQKDALQPSVESNLYPVAEVRNRKQAAKRRLDSLQRVLKMQKNRYSKGLNDYSSTGISDNPTPQEVMKQVQLARQKYLASQNVNQSNEPPVEDDLKNFKERMMFMDSLTTERMKKLNIGQAGNGKQEEQETGSHNQPIDPNADSTFQPLTVSLNKPHKMAFNTIRGVSPDRNIKAIIDVSKKVFAGSRVRIRLLDNIYVGNHFIQKGKYIYAMISGFQMHRINLSITSIMFHGNPLPVNLDVYDEDGYLGLFVPGSNFREFTKEIGTQGTNGMSTIRLSQAQDQKASIIQNLFRTTGSSVRKFIQKDKAYVKYNYIIYLKEDKTNR